MLKLGQLYLRLAPQWSKGHTFFFKNVHDMKADDEKWDRSEGTAVEKRTFHHVPFQLYVH